MSKRLLTLLIAGVAISVFTLVITHFVKTGKLKNQLKDQEANYQATIAQEKERSKKLSEERDSFRSQLAAQSRKAGEDLAKAKEDAVSEHLLAEIRKSATFASLRDLTDLRAKEIGERFGLSPDQIRSTTPDKLAVIAENHKLKKQLEDAKTPSVAGENKPPRAVIKIPPRFTLNVGQEALFDGGDSTDPDGKIVEYLWTMGDGSTFNTTSVTHKYVTARPGEPYVITLQVKDDKGSTNTAKTEVTVK